LLPGERIANRWIDLLCGFICVYVYIQDVPNFNIPAARIVLPVIEAGNCLYKKEPSDV
jgi:hypothetical protein